VRHRLVQRRPSAHDSARGHTRRGLPGSTSGLPESSLRAPSGLATSGALCPAAGAGERPTGRSAGTVGRVPSQPTSSPSRYPPPRRVILARSTLAKATWREFPGHGRVNLPFSKRGRVDESAHQDPWTTTRASCFDHIATGFGAVAARLGAFLHVWSLGQALQDIPRQGRAPAPALGSLASVALSSAQVNFILAGRKMAMEIDTA
jgi:hypothetical protein